MHLTKIATKPALYFPPHLFSALLLYLVTQATNTSDIHNDKHQNRVIESSKSQDKKSKQNMQKQVKTVRASAQSVVR